MWLLVASACGVAVSAPADGVPAAPEGEEVADPFAVFLAAPDPVADGFSSPLGRGWHACGEGCWEADRARPITAMADARVEVRGGAVTARSQWYDNAHKRQVALVVEGATPAVADGARVARGATLATGTRVQVRLDGAEDDPITFAAAWPELPVPQAERVLALVSHDADELRLYRDGEQIGSFQVGFGQAEGAKVRQGDNRTPKGIYYIVQASRGPFGGPSADFFGGYWMRVNYPNAWDAARAAELGWIGEDTQRSISRLWRARKETPKTTRLGGGIGLHGWAWEWDDDDPRGMSWGCVVMHLRDADTIMRELPVGSMIVLF